MIHGHTRIILRNPISGNIIKDVEHENTFQSSIIAEGVRNLGYAQASFYNNRTAGIIANPPYAEMLGGLLLFEDSITTPSQFAPLGAKMVGNGAFGVMNSSDPDELGSYNVRESVVTDSLLTQVWDFATNQANGKISSVCLTSRTGGYIGYGNKHNKQASTLWQLNRLANETSVVPQFPANQNGNATICNSTMYHFSLTGSTLTVSKWKAPLKRATVFDCIEKVLTIDVSALHYAYMGSDFLISASNEKIYIAPLGFITVGTSYLWQYDTADDTITELTISDPLNYEAYNGGYVAHDKVYFYVNNMTGGIKVYNLDGTLFDTIPTDDVVGGYSDTIIGELGNHVLLQWNRTTGKGRQAWIYDTSDKSLKLLNMNSEISQYQNQPLHEEEISKCLTYSQKDTYGLRGMYAINNPLYLATVNNLNHAVTKDATLIMKVIYSLSEA